ncbi:hypothetical protein L0F63_007270 [Massospora cicadina]|nr:hypothetical protein L0F63_007270 [Massospora cicadina]
MASPLDLPQPTFEVDPPAPSRAKPQFGSHQRTKSEKTFSTPSTRAQKRMSLIFEPNAIKAPKSPPQTISNSFQSSPSKYEFSFNLELKEEPDGPPEPVAENPEFDYIAGTDLAPLVFSSQSSSSPILSSTNSPQNLEFMHDERHA